MPLAPAQLAALAASLAVCGATWIAPLWPRDQALHSSLNVLCLGLGTGFAVAVMLVTWPLLDRSPGPGAAAP